MQPNLYTCISIGLKNHSIQNYLQKSENLHMLNRIGDICKVDIRFKRVGSNFDKTFYDK